MCIPILLLLTGAGGCRSFFPGGGGGHPIKKQKRPITIVLLQKQNSTECEARFSALPYHAFNDDEIAWEITNACPSPQTVTVAVNSLNRSPFTDPGPWHVASIANGATDDHTVLTVGPKGTVPAGPYKFDIIVLNGQRYDPILEIDP
jgi:hypothetical protein